MPDFVSLQAALLPLRFDPHIDAIPIGMREYNAFYQLGDLPVTSHIGTVPCNTGQLAVQYWLPDNATETVLIVHGYYDHIGLYGHVIRHFLARGYAVLGFDLPGHGLSTGERASIPSFDCYADAITSVLAAAVDKLPPVAVALGQSTGCAALMNGLMRNTIAPVPSLILLAPLLRPCGWAHHGEWVYALLHRWVRHVPRKFNVNSSDIAFVDFCKRGDPLQTRQLSVQWVGAMKHWLEHFESQPTIPTHTLLVQGDADTTVDWRYNVPKLIEKLPDCRLEYLPTAQHHLVNESPALREQLWQIIDHFLQSPD